LHRYPAHPLADSAALWLVRYYASSEVAWRNRRETSYNVQLVSATSQRQDPGQAAVPTRDEDGAPLEIIDRSQRAELSRTGQRQTAAPGLAPAQRAGRALAVANALERTRPTLLAAPTMQFPLSVARRYAGSGERGRNAPKEATLGITGTMPPGPWSDCVAAEEWIESNRGEPAKRVLSVVSAAEKPKLDGRLDDPLWQSAKSVRLTPAASQPGLSSTAVLAFDDEFLYIAASCQKLTGIDYATANEPRSHDSDLSRQDRVTLQLDVDRDYATWWELSIDHRGRPATSCFGDETWNPTWYIAAGGDESWWTVEAAIPLAELAPRKAEVRDVWAVQIQRVVPTSGVAAFAHPAAISTRPEGFGLLVFE
jgi:hypothetical protein